MEVLKSSSMIMWTKWKLIQITLYTSWHILLTDSFDRRHLAKLGTPNVPKEKREYHTLNFHPKDEVFMSNQSSKNNSIFISKGGSGPQLPPQPPQYPPPPPPPPPPVQCPTLQCPACEPCQCPPCPECYCAPCPPSQCPPCQCPDKTPKIIIQETEEYEEVVMKQKPG